MVGSRTKTLPALVNNTRSVSSANAISQWPCIAFRAAYHLCAVNRPAHAMAGRVARLMGVESRTGEESAAEMIRTCRPALEALSFLSPKRENSFVSNVTCNRVSVSFWYLTFSAACDKLEAKRQQLGCCVFAR